MGRKKDLVRYEETVGLLSSEELVRATEERMDALGLTPIQQKILMGIKKENDSLYNGEIRANMQEQLQKEIELSGQRGSVIDFMNAKMIEKALAGDVKAYDTIIGLTGEKKEVVEHKITKVQEIINDVIDVEEF